MSLFNRPVGILYEHPVWFNPLFKELERRRIPFVRIHAASHQYNPAERDVPYSIVVNRVGASAYLRGNQQGIFHSANYLAHVERLGIPVINGTAAQEIESSKASQLELLASLGLPFPKTRIVNHINQIVPAALSMKFPVVIKVNRIRNASSIIRFNSVDEIKKAISTFQLHLGVDHTALVQEYIPSENNHIVRVETLNGKFLYAVKIYTKSESFNLRPHDFMEGSNTHSLPVESPKSGIRVEAFTPSQDVIDQVQRIVKSARLDAGAVEYVVNSKDSQVYYCNIFATSNFIQNPIELLGFDPQKAFVDYIEKRLHPIYEIEPELAL